jgi:hypothetical protein
MLSLAGCGASLLLLLGCESRSDAPSTPFVDPAEAGSTVIGRPPSAASFVVPQQIVVSLSPYRTVGEALADADNVDWFRDTTLAQACTLAYAAEELKAHLAQVGISARIVSPAEKGEAPSFVLDVVDARRASDPPLRGTADTASQGFIITPHDGDVRITAVDRIGVLNGIYRILDDLGFAWYDPYETVAPLGLGPATVIEWQRLRETPRVALRGFWIVRNTPVPDAFAIWLARNRLNIGGLPRHSLQQLLGIKGWGGGHGLLSQEFSRPGLFEQHPDWFASIGGVRQPIAPGEIYYNPSFASRDAARYFADRMVQRLEHGDLRGIDVLNVWPADDVSNRFDQSPQALAIGNETDNLLNFYLNVAERLREANADGRLSRPITLGGISYLLTMKPPTNYSVVAALENSDYLHIFYPIERSWSQSFDASSPSDVNRSLTKNLDAWQSFARFDYGVVEYRNLSSYGAIGLSDFPHAAANFHSLMAERHGLIAYMHPLLRNPGPRRLTNRLLSRLAWVDDVGSHGLTAMQAAAESVTAEYFADRYGSYAPQWRLFHELMSESVDNTKEMFGYHSLHWVLFQRQFWESPPFSEREVVELIGRYRAGGLQDLPPAFVSGNRVSETFRGLDDSIALQQRALALWERIRTEEIPVDVRRRMKSDLAWADATASRYRLMAATADYVTARYDGTDVSASVARVAAEIDTLTTSPVTNDTVSQFDQGGFLSLHRALAGL